MNVSRECEIFIIFPLSFFNHAQRNSLAELAGHSNYLHGMECKIHEPTSAKFMNQHLGSLLHHSDL